MLIVCNIVLILFILISHFFNFRNSRIKFLILLTIFFTLFLIVNFTEFDFIALAEEIIEVEDNDDNSTEDQPDEEEDEFSYWDKFGEIRAKLADILFKVNVVGSILGALHLIMQFLG